MRGVGEVGRGGGRREVGGGKNVGAVDQEAADPTKETRGARQAVRGARIKSHARAERGRNFEWHKISKFKKKKNAHETRQTLRAAAAATAAPATASSSGSATAPDAAADPASVPASRSRLYTCRRAERVVEGHGG